MSTLVLEVKNARNILKEEGVKALFKKYGWKLFAIVFAYYLVLAVRSPHVHRIWFREGWFSVRLF